MKLHEKLLLAALGIVFAIGAVIIAAKPAMAKARVDDFCGENMKCEAGGCVFSWHLWCKSNGVTCTTVSDQLGCYDT